MSCVSHTSGRIDCHDPLRRTHLQRYKSIVIVIVLYFGFFDTKFCFAFCKVWGCLVKKYNCKIIHERGKWIWQAWKKRKRDCKSKIFGGTNSFHKQSHMLLVVYLLYPQISALIIEEMTFWQKNSERIHWHLKLSLLFQCWVLAQGLNQNWRDSKT